MKNAKLLIGSLALLLLLTLGSEVLFRFEVLNSASFGIAGWAYVASLVLVMFMLGVSPLLAGVRLPRWEDPASIADLACRRVFVRNYAERLLLHYGRAGKVENHEVLVRLQAALVRPDVSSDNVAEELEQATVAAHDWLTGDLCSEVIGKYMKRTGFVVAVSQRGLFDGLAMLYMQSRMINEIAAVMGYRPSWILRTKCGFWVMGNSFAFTLLESDDVLDGAMQQLVGVAVGDRLAGALPFVGKVLSSITQGGAAMATVYATGRMAQRYFAGQQKLTGEERIALRLEGLKKAVTLQVSSGNIRGNGHVQGD